VHEPNLSAGGKETESGMDDRNEQPFLLQMWGLRRVWKITMNKHFASHVGQKIHKATEAAETD
jgi:hypothetical protein